MNPNAILTISDLSTPKTPRRDLRQKTAEYEVPNGTSESSKTQSAEERNCKNGMCVVTWKPQKPHAA